MILEIPCGVASAWHLFIMTTELLERKCRQSRKIDHPYSIRPFIYMNYPSVSIMQKMNGKDEFVCDYCRMACRIFCD